MAGPTQERRRRGLQAIPTITAVVMHPEGTGDGTLLAGLRPILADMAHHCATFSLDYGCKPAHKNDRTFMCASTRAPRKLCWCMCIRTPVRCFS